MTKENRFSIKMVSKSDDELQYIIDNKSKFQEPAVLASIWELEKRNKAGVETKVIVSQIEKEQKNIETKQEKVKKESNITDDPNAPKLYNTKFILFFGVFFSVFAGSILLAMNLKRLDKEKKAWIVVFSGLVFSIIQIITLNNLTPNSTGLTMPVSLLGMYLLETFFWKKTVPQDLKYRKRKFWKPLIVASIIWSPLIYIAIITA